MKYLDNSIIGKIRETQKIPAWNANDPIEVLVHPTPVNAPQQRSFSL